MSYEMRSKMNSLMDNTLDNHVGFVRAEADDMDPEQLTAEVILLTGRLLSEMHRRAFDGDPLDIPYNWKSLGVYAERIGEMCRTIEGKFRVIDNANTEE